MKEALRVVIISLAVLATLAGANSQSQFNVVVVNSLGAAPLVVSCKSANGDLGSQTLMFDSTGHFSFSGKNRVSCSFGWGSHYEDFDIFVYDRDHSVYDATTTCVWKILPDGPCRTKPNSPSDIDVCYKWSY